MCLNCEYENTLARVDDMLEDEDFQFSSDFLESVQKWILSKSHVTPNQLKAIDNIEASVGLRNDDGYEQA